MLDEQEHSIYSDSLRFRGGRPVESQVVRLSPDSVALGELKLVVGSGRRSEAVSALVSFTQAWVVTNFDEMLDLLRYFGARPEDRRDAEGARVRARAALAGVLGGDRPQSGDAGERGAQPVLQPGQRRQPAFTDEGVPGLAHRSGRGLHHASARPTRASRRTPGDGRPGRPLDLHRPAPGRSSSRTRPASAASASPRVAGGVRADVSAEATAEVESGTLASRLLAGCPTDPPRLFLLDGYALIYRAFFAMISRPLRTTKGENTSAAWGVANFLLRLREKYGPDYVAWVNDAGNSFREERYPEYKSTREKLDDELQADFDRSVERIGELLDGVRHSARGRAGLRGRRRHRDARHAGGRARPPGGDRLRRQGLLPAHRARASRCSIPAAAAPRRRGDLGGRVATPPSGSASPRRRWSTTWRWWATVSDNIPGVKGIGEKGAQKLLAEYGNLDTILASAGRGHRQADPRGAAGQADNARLSRELVTIKRDVPVELDLDAHDTSSEPDFDALRRILTELEFFSLAKKLQGQGTATPVSDVVRPASRRARPPRRRTAADPLAERSSIRWSRRPRSPVVDDPADLPALVARLRAAPIVAHRHRDRPRSSRTTPT